MPFHLKQSSSDQYRRFHRLKNEVQRQINVLDYGNWRQEETVAFCGPVDVLKLMGPAYHSRLTALASQLESLSSVWESLHNPDDLDLEKVLGEGFATPSGMIRTIDFDLLRTDLFWQIPAFCEPSPIYVDVKRCYSTVFSFNDHLTYNGEFWDSEKLSEWASNGESSILLVQGDYQSAKEVGGIALDLVAYLEEHSEPAVWILNDMFTSEYIHHANDILKQLAVQILRRNAFLPSNAYLPRLVELFQLSSGISPNTNWFDVLHFVLRGMPNLCMVIDLGVLNAEYETASCWLKQFSDLFERLRLEGSLILKVVLLNTWPLPSCYPSSLIIDINSQTRPPHLQRMNFATRNQGTRSLQFPAQRVPIGASPSTVSNFLSPAVDVTAIHAQSSNKLENVIGEVAAARERANGPADWFSQMKSFEKLVDASRKEPDAAHPRVKIAILDTGLDLSHRDIVKAKEEGRLKFWDFVDNTNTIKDDDGHGTHCTSIALKYAPNAELFVGRVFRKSQADSDSCGILTRAIRHAAEVWRVNIVSLSLGFTEDDDDDSDHLRDEIRKASGSSILIIASAANNTSNERAPVRFPARMKEVMCIFSSNSFGRPSDFNPGPKYDRPNLTFPGEKVKGAWPSSLANGETFEWKGATYKYQSGTSCSTPIAAAVAAGILEFAWQERIPAVRRVKLLKHYTGMTQIFMRRMVDDYKVGDNSYNYVKPWKLISTSCQKDEIPVLISDALDHINS